MSVLFGVTLTPFMRQVCPHQNCHPSHLYPSPLTHPQSVYLSYYAQATVVSSRFLNTEWPPSLGLFIPGFSGPNPHLLQILAKVLPSQRPPYLKLQTGDPELMTTHLPYFPFSQGTYFLAHCIIYFPH